MHLCDPMGKFETNAYLVLPSPMYATGSEMSNKRIDNDQVEEGLQRKPTSSNRKEIIFSIHKTPKKGPIHTRWSFLPIRGTP